MKNKVKYVKSLVISSILIFISAIVWGAYELTNDHFLIGLGLIFEGDVLSWNDWGSLLKKNK